MKCVLSVLLSFLLLGLFVVTFVEAGGGSGSNESGGSGSHEKHDKHKHKRRGHHHNQHDEFEDESGSRHHHNRPAFIPQLPTYPSYSEMPPYQPYGGLHGPMQGQMPFYDGKQIILTPLIHGVPYPNFFYPPSFQPAVGEVTFRGEAGALPPQATQGFSPGVISYPGSAAFLPLGYSPVAGTAYAHYGMGYSLTPPAASANPSQSEVQASGSAATLPLPQATLAYSGTTGSNGGSANGITSSSLDHHLKENREYEESGHKHSVNNY